MPKEITPEFIKDKINSWFLEENNKHSISTFLKTLILQKINDEDKEINFHLMRKVCDRIDVSISLLVSDFFLMNYFHYTLSVFSSEIFSTALKDYVSDYFKKISYGWDPRKLPTLDYPTVYKILSSLDINPTGPLGSDIINRYYLMREGSLLKILVSILKKGNEINQTQITYSVSVTDKCEGTDNNLDYLEQMEDYFLEKELHLLNKIREDKEEFERRREALSLCHESLKMKLEQALSLITQLKNENNCISKELDLAKSQGRLIADINEKLSSFSEVFDKIQGSNYFQNVSCSSINEPEICNKFCENTSCQTESDFKNVYCQIEICTKEEFTETVELAPCIKDVGTQTDTILERSIIKKFEEEKAELIAFIEQLQGRINVLTEKTVALNKIISEKQAIQQNIIEADTKLITVHKDDNTHSKSQPKCCKQFENLGKIVDCHSFCIDTLKNRLEFLKNNSLDTEAKCNAFLEQRGVI